MNAPDVEYTVRQVATKLHLSESRVCQLLRSGVLEGGRRWLIAKNELSRYGQAATPPQGVHEEDPTLASRRHWPELSRVAVALQDQVRTGAPIANLLGLPWQTWPDYSASLILGVRPGGVHVSLSAEEGPVFAALKEHLPDDEAWELLAVWKEAVIRLRDRALALCDLVKGQPELKGKVWIDLEQPESVGPGLTDFFKKTIALDVAERGCGLPQALHNYEVSLPNASEPSVLRLVRNGSSFVAIAKSPSKEELDLLRELHLQLRVHLIDDPTVERLVRAHVDLKDARNALDAALERISHLVRFPGVCHLYRTV